MKRLATLMLLAGLLVCIGQRQASAISISLEPVIPTVTAGDSLDVAVVISGLSAGGPPSIGGFDIEVSFDDTIVTPVAVVFGPFLGDPLLFEAFTDAVFLADIVKLAEVSLLSPTGLDALQPGSFVLATLSFDAIATGAPALSLSQAAVFDAFGNPIPEPNALLIFSIGLLGLQLARRKRQVNPSERDQTQPISITPPLPAGADADKGT